MKHILFVVLVLALSLSATVAQAEVIAWDKSSVELTGICLPNGDAQFTATNTGRGMDGPTAWREYEADTLTQQGAVILAASGSYVWTFASKGVPVRFEIDQRPGHPGSSHPSSRSPAISQAPLACAPSRRRAPATGAAAHQQISGAGWPARSRTTGPATSAASATVGCGSKTCAPRGCGGRTRPSPCRAASTRAGNWTARRASRCASASDIKGRAATLPTGRSDRPGRRMIPQERR